MAPLSLAAGLALLATATSTVADEVVWSSVAYVFRGERTPVQKAPSSALTPLGAQQLYNQGAIFRARYLDNNTGSSSQSGVTYYAPIQGIESSAVDNSQLDILSTTDECVTSSAMAFLQGLYPPRNQTFAFGKDPFVLADHTVVDFPLGGYQYPKIRSLGLLDLESTWIEGNVACTQYTIAALGMRNYTTVQSIYQNTLDFYQGLWTSVFQEDFSRSETNFYAAYELYEYAQYEYTHNPQIRNSLNATQLNYLRQLAAIQQRDLNGNLTVSGKYKGDMIQAISGRMLAGKIVQQLRSSRGTTHKLNLMFGSHEPIVAFFAISGLVDYNDTTVFEDLPSPGATMVFEMYSTDHKNMSIYPNLSELRVRFLYRPSSEPGVRLDEYPLFSNGNSNATSQPRGMRFDDFANGMQALAINTVMGWCEACDSAELFCIALEDNQRGGSSYTSGGSIGSVKITPAVAGVIGGALVLAIMGLVALVAVVLGRVRFYRLDRKPNPNSSLGGFKGAEKMASDSDLAVAKGGVRHERVGSWELRTGNEGPTSTVSTLGAVLDKDQSTTAKTRRVADEDDDADDISVMGASPVKPREEF